MVENFPNFQSKTLENVNTVIDLLKLLPNNVSILMIKAVLKVI